MNKDISRVEIVHRLSKLVGPHSLAGEAVNSATAALQCGESGEAQAHASRAVGLVAQRDASRFEANGSAWAENLFPAALDAAHLAVVGTRCPDDFLPELAAQVAELEAIPAETMRAHRLRELEGDAVQTIEDAFRALSRVGGAS